MKTLGVQEERLWDWIREDFRGKHGEDFNIGHRKILRVNKSRFLGERTTSLK